MPSNNSTVRRSERRTDAEFRQGERDRLSDKQQLAILDSRPGMSAKERKRLSS